MGVGLTVPTWSEQIPRMFANRTEWSGFALQEPRVRVPRWRCESSLVPWL